MNCYSRWISFVAVGLSCACSASTGDGDEAPGPEGRIQVAREAPETLTDEDGLVWVRSRAIEHRPAQLVTRGPRRATERPSLDSMSDEELAELLRPVRPFMGYEYQLSAADTLPMVRRARGGGATSATLPFVPEGVGLADLDEGFPDAVGRVGQKVFGSDNRARVSAADRNLYPFTTMAAFCNPDVNQRCEDNTAGCTATRIGPNTLLTAAHCVYDGGIVFAGGTGFYPLASLMFAADNSGATGSTSSFPKVSGDPNLTDTNFSSCYSVTVPLGWALWADDALDIAVIRLSPVNGNGAACPAVGNTGWLGVRPNVDPNGKTFWLYGYPGTRDDEGGPAPPVFNCYQDCTNTEPELGQPCPTFCDPNPMWGYPTLFGIGNSTVSDNNILHPSEVTHYIDASGGQSGSAIYGLFSDTSTRHADPSAFPFSGQGLFAIAVHTGYYDDFVDDYNAGVHIDFGLLSFLETNGGLGTTTHNPCTCEPGLFGPVCYCNFL